MTEKTKVRRFGGSLGVIIPKSVADSLALQEGDELYVSSTPDGIAISPYDPDFAEAMEDAREFMRSHRNAFRELAE
ncbi:MAG TPA: AbrB/MazE/SpoVT family DNA-binding domain-containing protein [Rhodothermales bacterium]|nr:AbrB/MazE/SpoVT family DNA-binding domain-containing protein [Rhodothermales bacterium]